MESCFPIPHNSADLSPKMLYPMQALMDLALGFIKVDLGEDEEIAKMGKCLKQHKGLHLIPNTLEKASCDVMHLQSQCWGGRNRRLPGTCWATV